MKTEEADAEAPERVWHLRRECPANPSPSSPDRVARHAWERPPEARRCWREENRARPAAAAGTAASHWRLRRLEQETPEGRPRGKSR